MQGETAEARAAYQDLLSRWKDADPENFRSETSKAEYAADFRNASARKYG